MKSARVLSFSLGWRGLATRTFGRGDTDRRGHGRLFGTRFLGRWGFLFGLDLDFFDLPLDNGRHWSAQCFLLMARDKTPLNGQFLGLPVFVLDNMLFV